MYAVITDKILDILFSEAKTLYRDGGSLSELNHNAIHMRSSSQYWEFHRQLLMQRWCVTHVLILYNVLVIYKDFGVPWVAVSTLVVDVQFLVVVPIVAFWSTPGGEPPYFCLRPGVVWVVQGKCWYSRPVQIKWVECIAVQ